MASRRKFIEQASGATGALLFSQSLQVFATTLSNSEALITQTPTDNGKALVNPNMGWELYFYSDIIANYGSKLIPSDTMDEFPGLSTVYMRVPWAFIEQAEGRYNWELLDTPAQRWIDKGKKVAFRITASESNMQYATPEWVKNAGAKGHDWKDENTKRTCWEPKYDDPVFLRKTESFIAAMAARYDNNPNVAYVDIGHFGLWGEGHTVLTTKIDYSLDVMKKYVDIYCKYFKNTQVVIGDDFAGPYSKGRRFPITDYAFSKGVTLRDDSILVFAPPNSWQHAEMAQLFWPKKPVILEHAHVNLSIQTKAWSKELLLQAIEAYHASYLSIQWWPKVFLQDNRDIIDRINMRMGYRIQLRSISWPNEIQIGHPFKVTSSWSNVGVAPCYPGGFFCLTIKDDKGGIIAILIDESYNMKSLAVAELGKAPIQNITSSFTIAPAFKDIYETFFRVVAANQYDVFVSVGMSDGTPVLELPYNDDDGHKRYRVGKITLTSRT